MKKRALCLLLTDFEAIEKNALVASRGAATSAEFGVALVRRLCGDATLAEVS